MILHADLSTGVSGDKMLGALLELCECYGVADFTGLEALALTLVPGITIERERVIKAGIGATQIHISEEDPPARSWQQIREMITQCAATGTLSHSAADLAIRVFGDIADAEARVHGVAVEQVHFHEVGAADSIIDVVGCCYLLTALDPARFYATPLALGNGTMRCDHGELPIPAPATIQLISGLPVYASQHQGELTTPTGAALASAFVTDWEPLPHMRPMMVGFGAGTMNLFGAANVVRIIAGEPADLSGSIIGNDDGIRVENEREPHDREPLEGTLRYHAAQDHASCDQMSSGFTVQGCTLLETNIDHLSPEALAYICEQLLNKDALDVWQEPIVMKKSRLAVRLCVLCATSAAQMLAQDISAATGSLGVRSRYVERTIAPRNTVILETSFGPIPFKAANICSPCDSVSWLRPEYEAVAALARERGIEFVELYDQLVREQGRSTCNAPESL